MTAPRRTTAAKEPPHISKSMQEVLNVRGAVSADRNATARLSDQIGLVLSRPALFFAVLAAHVLWIVVNLPLWPWPPWDPYPFMFLATVASVEAPFIALLVLMHQQRNERIAELRDELDLQVSLQVEREVAMALRLLREVQQHASIPTDQDLALLARMEEELRPRVLMEHIRSHLDHIEGDEAP